jgi:hypothetical protein
VISVRDFFETVAEDPRMLASHMIIYIALMNTWEQQGRPEEIEFVTSDILKVVKLTRDTFRIRIRELKEFGYIRYEAAGNQFGKGIVVFRKL